MSILTVGPSGQYSTIASAIAASHNGDTIQVAAGTYTNDFAIINDNITITGVGGMVNLVATADPSNGKAILVTNGNDTIENVSFSGAKVPDDNGAGIRYQNGNLTLINDYFHDNQEGLLAASNPAGSITIENSEFYHNGDGSGLTHNLYVGKIGTLTIDNSLFMDAVVGHEIKSRAETTIIENSRIIDGPTGTASYSVDVPNGGNVVIKNNVIEQGPLSQNPAIVHFGGANTAAGGVYANSSLQITGNTVLNDLHQANADLLYNETLIPATITNNQIYGLTEAQLSPHVAAVESGNTFLTTEPALNTTPPFGAPTSGAGSVNGAPAIAAPGSEVVGQGHATAISGVRLSETGNTVGETFRAIASDSQGILSATGTGVSGSGTTTLTLLGSLAQVNADLATLKDTDGTVAPDTIKLNASDSLGNSATPKAIAVTVHGSPETGGANLTAAGYLSQLNSGILRPDAGHLAVLTATSAGQILHAQGLDIMLIGTATHDILAGANGFDVLVGGPGSEHLLGGSGTTDFLAGSGNNELVAGSGTNYMQAGAGHDHFDFVYGHSGNSTIYGFNPALDHVDIEAGGAKVTAVSLVRSVTADAAGDAVIHLGDHQIVLEGVTPSHVSAGWFTVAH